MEQHIEHALSELSPCRIVPEAVPFPRWEDAAPLEPPIRWAGPLWGILFFSFGGSFLALMVLSGVAPHLIPQDNAAQMALWLRVSAVVLVVSFQSSGRNRKQRGPAAHWA
jgi:hypothetical protein